MNIKKSTLVILFLTLVLTINGQGRHRGNVETNVLGETVYTNNNGLKATLSNDIFDNLIYKDNNGNSIFYSKEIAPQILSAFGNDKYRLIYWFVDTTRRLKDSKEKYSYDIFDNIHYENNSGMKASLSEDVFDNQTYKDSNGNEVVFSKDTWGEELAMYNNNRFDVFTSLMDYCRGNKSLKIKNKTDIFGNTQQSVKDSENSYESSIGKDIFGNLQYKENNFKASIETNIFDDKVYKDSNNNEIKYSKEFIDLINKQGYEFENDNQLLNRLLRFCKDKKNYKEEYSVDIFGDINFKQNNGQTIKTSPREYRYAR